MEFNTKIVDFIRELYQTNEFIPLHAPIFQGGEKDLVCQTIDSTFVSSVGEFVDQLEESICEYTGSKYAIAVVNGTAALHLSLLAVGVSQNQEVITQPLSFVATCNAINYCGASPVFIDVDLDDMGLSPTLMQKWLEANASIKANQCINKNTGKVISACVPMHSFGHPCKIDLIKQVCDQWNIRLVEDAAESLGSFYKGKHTGLIGDVAAISFNGNKIITTGGGGIILTQNKQLAQKLKHQSTTAKLPHPWEYNHDDVGFNYRMPNLNAALGCAQLSQLSYFLENKRELSEQYSHFFKSHADIKFISEPVDAISNYWLNCVLFPNRLQRDEFLRYSNDQGVMTRPAWTLLNELPMYRDSPVGDLTNAKKLVDRLVSIPSSVRNFS